MLSVWSWAIISGVNIANAMWPFHIHYYFLTNKMLQHTSINNKHLQSSNVHAKLTSLLQIYIPLMRAQDRKENTSVTISYGSFINQFPLDTIKSIRQLERTCTKICRQTSLYCSEKYALMKRCCLNLHTDTHTHTHTHIYIYIYRRKNTHIA